MFDKHRNPNGTYNGVTAMAEVTGLPQGEILSLFEQIKANSAKLRACPWHEFVTLPVEPGRPDYEEHSRYRCKHCQGEVDFSAYHWHEQGRRVKPVATEAEWQELVQVIENSTCSRILRAVGKPYPRTCKVHGLTCGMEA